MTGQASRDASGRFDPFAPEFRAAPYPVYAHYRTHDPVHFGISAHSGHAGAWYLFRHHDVMAALVDPRLGRDARRGSAAAAPSRPAGAEAFVALFEKWLVFLDPPDHTRLRGLVSRAFTPATVERLRPRVVRLCHELVDGMIGRGRVDLVEAFALPLPLIVIAELLGVEAADRGLLARWSAAMASASNFRRGAPLAVHVGAGEAARAMSDYIRDLARARARAPREDLLSALVAAETGDGRLSEAELVATCVHLLTAGHETVVHLITKGTLALARDPRAMQALRRGEAPIGAIVEELLRFDGPVQIVTRWALADLEIGARRVRRGEPVALALGAANRDPKAFPRPDALDFRRRGPRHATFGHGIHYCLGAALARLEGEVAFAALAGRLPGLRVPPQELAWQDSVVFHGLERLWVEPGA